jgi:hypothetical protein
VSAVLASAWSLVAWVGLVVAIAQIAPAHRRLDVPSDALGWAWRLLFLSGFAITWTFMIRMAAADVARYPSLAAWARESNLFFDAYRRVTETPPAWWWSQHLMGWALAGVLWFCVEGRRRGVRFWAYAWLAMCVAVSVALPAFAQRRRAEAEVPGAEQGVPALVTVGIGAAALALVAAPSATGPRFVVAMLVLHGGLLVPALLTPRSAGRERSFAAWPVARSVALVCFALHVGATLRLHAEAPRALLDVVLRDPAQASISSDVLLTWVACALFVATTRGRRRAALFVVTAPVVSLGAAFAWAALGPRQPQKEGRPGSGGVSLLREGRAHARTHLALRTPGRSVTHRLRETARA